MSLVLTIWQLLLRLAQSQTRGFADLKQAVQANSDKLDQIITLLTVEQAVTIQFTTDLDGQITIGATTTSMTDSQQETLTIAPLDKKGKPAQLDGVPVWATSDATVATVDAGADPTGLTAVLTAVSPGTCDVTVTGDADMGTGVAPIVGKLTVTVTPGQATQITITEGTPTEQA